MVHVAGRRTTGPGDCASRECQLRFSTWKGLGENERAGKLVPGSKLRLRFSGAVI